jgi:hypothetical protein
VPAIVVVPILARLPIPAAVRSEITNGAPGVMASVSGGPVPSRTGPSVSTGRTSRRTNPAESPARRAHHVRVMLTARR